MKILYLDCGMGAAGDMLSAALLALLPDPDAFVESFNALGLPGVTAARETATRCGVQGTRFHVRIDGTEEDEHSHDRGGERHHHHGLRDIEQIVARLALEQAVKDDVLAVYGLLAEAESRVHGVPVTDIHFHEVGTLDAVADIAAACLLFRRLAPDEVVASPVCVGGGTVRCAHGVLPVPAPATAELLRGVPIYGGSIQSELCTPTGAALLRRFVTRYGELPPMRTLAVGSGMGKKEFERANCLRAFLGETGYGRGGAALLNCNVDDMTGEELGYAMERLYDAGALEVFTVPAGMKKSRPGTLLEVLCREEDTGTLVEALFRHTTTLGVRETPVRRYVLERRIVEVDTPYGTVRRKDSAGYGAEKRKYEFDDLARVARERDIPLAEARRLVGEYDGEGGAP